MCVCVCVCVRACVRACVCVCVCVLFLETICLILYTIEARMIRWSVDRGFVALDSAHENVKCLLHKNMEQALPLTIITG